MKIGDKKSLFVKKDYIQMPLYILEFLTRWGGVSSFVCTEWACWMSGEQVGGVYEELGWVGNRIMIWADPNMWNRKTMIKKDTKTGRVMSVPSMTEDVWEGMAVYLLTY